MKVISIWQPFASLVVHRHKVFETRTWPAPQSLIGTRIGIAATKNIVPGQRQHFANEEFQRFYARTGLAEKLEDLPCGYLLGTVIIDSLESITREFLSDVSEEELQYGWYQLDGWAWRLVDPIALENPIPIRGKQGIYDWNGDLTGDATTEKDEALAQDEKGPHRRGYHGAEGSAIRSHLRLV